MNECVCVTDGRMFHVIKKKKVSESSVLSFCQAFIVRGEETRRGREASILVSFFLLKREDTSAHSTRKTSVIHSDHILRGSCLCHLTSRHFQRTFFLLSFSPSPVRHFSHTDKLSSAAVRSPQVHVIDSK